MLKRYLNNLYSVYNYSNQKKYNNSDIAYMNLVDYYYQKENDILNSFNNNQKGYQVKMVRGISDSVFNQKKSNDMLKLYLKYSGLYNVAGTKDYIKSENKGIKNLYNAYLSDTDAIKKDYQKQLDKNYSNFSDASKKLSTKTNVSSEIFADYDKLTDVYYYNGVNYRLGEATDKNHDIDTAVKIYNFKGYSDSMIPDNMIVTISGAEKFIKKGNKWYKAYKIG